MVAILFFFAAFCTVHCSTLFLNSDYKLTNDDISTVEEGDFSGEESDWADLIVQSALKQCKEARYCCPVDTRCCSSQEMSTQALRNFVGFFVSSGLCCTDNRALPGWPC